MRGALLAGAGLGARDDVGVVAAHEVAAHLRLLLLQHLVQRAARLQQMDSQQLSFTGPSALKRDADRAVADPGTAGLTNRAAI